MRPPTKRWPWLLIVPLLALVCVTQNGIDEQNLMRDPKTGAVRLNADHQPMTRYRPIHPWRPGVGISDQFAHLMPVALVGMKSALADILWVKADGYFHIGRYDRIMPLCYLITWLDPRFLDVYIIGSWHMAYNFMDRRYIPAGVDFLKKGIHNNPDAQDLFFELGNLLMDKAEDFNQAATYLKLANDQGLQPSGRRHAYAHALEKGGHVEESIKAWEALYKEEKAQGKWEMAEVSRRNRDITIWRREMHKLRAKKPLNVVFDYKWSIPKPRVLSLEGTTNLPDLTRVNVVLRDKDFDRLVKEHSVNWQVTSLSLFWDNFVVYDGKFISRFRTEKLDFDRIDLKSEPYKYPLQSDEYEVILTVNPRVEPIPTQDVIGLSGEGMTGPNVQDVNGIKMVRKVFTVTRKQLLGKS